MKHSSIRHVFACLFAAGAITMASCGGSSSTENTSDSTTSGDMQMDTSKAAAPAANVTHAEAVLTGTKADTAVDGKVSFDADSGKVKMKLELTVPKMANKTVAVHIHDHPDCGDNGNATHGHWNPTHSPHGKWGVDSFHLGDIGNVKLDAQGKGSLEMSTNLWTLSSDTSSTVLNHAVIVHSGKDDYKTQPTGNAGSRIGCGVIK